MELEVLCDLWNLHCVQFD